MMVSFTLSELLPLTLVVYGIYLQIDWKKVQLMDSSRDGTKVPVLEAEVDNSLNESKNRLIASG